METGANLTYLPILGEQDALKAEEHDVVAAELMASEVSTVDSDAFLNVIEIEDWELEGAVGLDKVERVAVNRKLCELQEKRRSKKQKVPTSVSELFTFANKLLGSADAHMSIAKHAIRVNR